ncbi:hypothetical protein B1A_04080, partial [mine drainage metagenome]
MYDISDQVIKIAWDNDQGILTINDKLHSAKSIGKTPLPDNVLIYYSGHNDTVADLVRQYEANFSKRIKKADLNESRRFIGIGPEYKALLLTVLLLQKTDNKAREFICGKLGIATVAQEVTLVLKRPAFADKKFKIEAFDPKTHFWGVEGITRQFLDKLIGCVKGAFNHGNVYNAADDRYRIVLNIESVSATS